MGILRQGVLGGFRKKTGTVVGASHRGQDIIRGLPRISKKTPSKGQLDQRTKFGLVIKFLSRIGHLINPGFAAAAGITSAINEAVDYHLNNAIKGTSPNFSLDLTKLKFSSGRLLTVDDLLVESTTPGKLKFIWTHDSQDSSEVDSTDLLTVLAYNPAKGRFVSMHTQVHFGYFLFFLLMLSKWKLQQLSVSTNNRLSFIDTNIWLPRCLHLYSVGF